jgi:hypothetical protein
MPGYFHDLAPMFGQCRSADGPEYWDDIEARHRGHRRQLRKLLMAIGLFCLGGLLLHPAVFALAIMVLPLLALELVMLRLSAVG